MLSMMRSPWLLYTLFALVAQSVALGADDVHGIEAYVHQGIRRQASPVPLTSGAATPSKVVSVPADSKTSDPPTTRRTTPTTPTDEPTSAEPTSTEPTTAKPTSAEPTRPEPTTTTPTPTPDRPTSDRPASTPPSTSPAPAPSPTESPPDSTTRITTPVITTSSFTSTSVTAYTTIVRTISNGQQIDVTTVSSVTSVFTSAAEVTVLPSPQEGGSSGGGGGLSDSSKKVIGGVVGGIGGAILLAGLAFLYWRVRGRKKRVSADDADLMAGTGAALGDKPQTGVSPFQANLEQYHNPGGRPNAAANF